MQSDGAKEIARLTNPLGELGNERTATLSPDRGDG